MRLFWSLILLAVVLCVVSEYNKPSPLGFKQVELEITAIQPPTQLYLWFRVVGEDRLYEKVYIAKTCQNWKRIKVGDRVWLVEATFNEDGQMVKRLKDPTSLITTLYCGV